MLLAYLLLLTGLTISAVAIYYSVIGLTAIFAAAAIPIIIMGVSLEVAKLVSASWLKQNWSRAPFLIKTYMSAAVIVLMLITSMGIFGFLSKAHLDQSLISGDVQSRISVYDQQIVTATENIELKRKTLEQLDRQVNQTLSRTQEATNNAAVNRSVTIRRSQAKERAQLQSEITQHQKDVVQLRADRAPIAAEVRKVEAEVGPLKYIAAFVYGTTPDANLLEKAVTWVIILIVVVFDPLAIIMLLAAQMSFTWRKEDKLMEGNSPRGTTDVIDAEPPTVTEQQEEVTVEPVPAYEQDDGPLTAEQLDQIVASVPTLTESVTDRVARGETFVNSNGSEELAASQEIVATDDNLDVEIPKKKTYLTKDQLGIIQLKNREL